MAANDLSVLDHAELRGDVRVAQEALRRGVRMLRGFDCPEFAGMLEVEVKRLEVWLQGGGFLDCLSGADASDDPQEDA